MIETYKVLSSVYDTNVSVLCLLVSHQQYL